MNTERIETLMNVVSAAGYVAAAICVLRAISVMLHGGAL